MDDHVKLNHLDDALDVLEYPVDRQRAAEQCDDVTLDLADGHENLGAVIAGSTQNRFHSADELASEVRSLLPQHAVGDPYQSEGEG